jgi:hypothetical protein
LNGEDVRPVGVTPGPDVSFARRDLVECSAEVECPGLVTLRDGPRDRSGERPIDLEDAGTVAETPELPAIETGNGITDDLQKLARCHVEQHRGRLAGLGQRRDPDAGANLAAEIAQVRRQGIDQMLGTAAWKRPARKMPQQAQNHPVRGCAGFLHAQHRVCGRSRQERGGPLSLEAGSRQSGDRADR